MAKPFVRLRIPNGSIFTVKVSGKGDADAQAFAAEGHFQRPDGSEGEWTDAELRAGRRRTLRSPGVYSGRADINFAKQSTARLQMEVLKPDGSKHVYDETITRTTNLDRTNVILVMKRDPAAQ